MVCNYSWWRNVLIRKKYLRWLPVGIKRNEIKKVKWAFLPLTFSFPYWQKWQRDKPDSGYGDHQVTGVPF